MEICTFAGRNAIKYLKEIRKDDIMIPEISFGNGLFNYYSVWISEKYPILKPVIKLFPKGDKLKELNNLVRQKIHSIQEQKLSIF